jgi:hypothetical protein
LDETLSNEAILCLMFFNVESISVWSFLAET